MQKYKLLEVVVLFYIFSGSAPLIAGDAGNSGFHDDGLVIRLLSKPTEVLIEGETAVVGNSDREKVIVFDAFIPKKGERTEVVDIAMNLIEEALREKKPGISDFYDESPSPYSWERISDSGIIYTHVLSDTYEAHTWYIPLAEKRSVRLLRVVSIDNLEKEPKKYIKLKIGSNQLYGSLDDLVNALSR